MKRVGSIKRIGKLDLKASERGEEMKKVEGRPEAWREEEGFSQSQPFLVPE